MRDGRYRRRRVTGGNVNNATERERHRRLISEEDDAAAWVKVVVVGGAKSEIGGAGKAKVAVGWADRVIDALPKSSTTVHRARPHWSATTGP